MRRGLNTVEITISFPPWIRVHFWTFYSVLVIHQSTHQRSPRLLIRYEPCHLNWSLVLILSIWITLSEKVSGTKWYPLIQHYWYLIYCKYRLSLLIGVSSPSAGYSNGNKYVLLRQTIFISKKVISASHCVRCRTCILRWYELHPYRRILHSLLCGVGRVEGSGGWGTLNRRFEITWDWFIVQNVSLGSATNRTRQSTHRYVRSYVTYVLYW